MFNKNYYHIYNLCVYICYRSITKQINEAVGQDSAQRTLMEVRNKVKRLKADYHQEREQRNRSGAGGGSRFPYFEQMNGMLGTCPRSTGHSSFTSLEVPEVPDEADGNNVQAGL